MYCTLFYESVYLIILVSMFFIQMDKLLDDVFMCFFELQPLFQARDGVVIDWASECWENIISECHCGVCLWLFFLGFYLFRCFSGELMSYSCFLCRLVDTAKI